MDKMDDKKNISHSRPVVMDEYFKDLSDNRLLDSTVRKVTAMEHNRCCMCGFQATKYHHNDSRYYCDYCSGVTLKQLSHT